MLNPPLFTMKHYARIIKVMRVTRPVDVSFYPNDSDARNVVLISRVQWDSCVIELADKFAKDNPKFKRDLFIQACNEQVTEPSSEVMK